MDTLEQRVELNERNSRQLNLRIFGFNAYDNGTGSRFRNPRGVWMQLLRDGLHISEDEAKGIHLAQCHWVGKGAFLIVRFLRYEDRVRVLSQRTKLGSVYKPHGRVISLKNDMTKEQARLYAEANKTYKALTDKRIRATNVDGQIKIDGKLYAHDDPFILDMLNN